MIHSATSSTQNRWFFHDHRLLFAARCCILSLELKREAFDDEHEVRSRRESAPRNKLRERLKISLMKIARGERLEVSLISPWTDDQIKKTGAKTSMIFSSFESEVVVAFSGSNDGGNVLWVWDLISSIWPGLHWQYYLFSKQPKIHIAVSLTIFKES